MGLHFECSSKDYLIGCGLGFRIKEWHLPKNWVGDFLKGEGTFIVAPRISPLGPTPSWISELLVGLGALAQSVPVSLHVQRVLLLDQERESW